MIFGSTSVSLDCISSGNLVSRSIVRAILFVCIPAFVTLSCVLYWTIVSWMNQKSFDYLQKRCLLSFFAVSYIGYVSVTRTAMSIVSCIRVFDSPDLDSNDFSFYWTMDTSINCYEGEHAYLAALLGWPTLFFFSLGYPILLAFFLMKHHPTRSSRGWSHDIAGFLFQAYNPKFISWESVVMLRKALLAVVVVFGYQLGSVFQEIIAVGVLAFSLKLHYICSPFKEDFSDVNDIEGWALFASMLCFAFSLSFIEGTPDFARTIMTVLLFVGVCSMFLFLMVKLSSAGIAYARFSLIADGVHVHRSRGNFKLMSIFVRSKITRRAKDIKKYLRVNSSEP